MAFLTFDQVGIRGIAAAVPANRIINREYTEFFSAADVADIVDKTGIEERRFAPDGMCASDLCQAAAERLIADLGIDKSEIDLLVFVSQTPDYRMPATAVLLQDRLGLSKQTMAFDLSLGCSAFVYALSVVYALVQNGTIRKALLLDGETRSRAYYPKDRRVAFLFGDGGVAALIEKNEKFGKSYFSLNSDGSRGDLIKIKSGGYRFPSSEESVQEKVLDEYGNISTDEHGTMNGAEVFNFVLEEIPGDLKNIMAYAGISKEDPDFFVFHQANAFMNGYLAKKMKLPSEKVPSSIHEFGNTSSVSIPLTIVSQLQGKLEGSKKLLLCGFGVGMSWASAVMDLQDCKVSDLVEL
ncbi:3-oxoacyl-ACP synthase III family protein [Rhodonellum sp.]|uniref:3-oxoacyl-ACP synthase III family protein n=1 Tax=Rhodonellum sp. TaxID=2231180 RepID=UPI00271AE9FE|nr:ketoacyl-ACP synthase III [Rhodonellum sp.]MDO9551560.1 ketoacyl-ACP synthase III [Rhodonellum sp.]